jgi:hypothetical protein
MKTSKWAFGALALAGALFAGSALAHGHGRVVVGLGFGFGYPAYYYPSPYYYPAYYPYPYYPPQQVVVQQPPVSYTERQDTHEAGYWYYCAASKGYYPYVKECPAGWQKVSPQPQN